MPNVMSNMPNVISNMPNVISNHSGRMPSVLWRKSGTETGPHRLSVTAFSKKFRFNIWIIYTINANSPVRNLHIREANATAILSVQSMIASGPWHV